jgi:hypothetical protein
MLERYLALLWAHDAVLREASLQDAARRLGQEMSRLWEGLSEAEREEALTKLQEVRETRLAWLAGK